MGSLSDDAKRAIEQNVLPRLHERPCSVCGSSKWLVLDGYVSTPEIAPAGFGGSTVTVPLVMTTCQICGHVVLFNAIHVGAFKPGQSPDQSFGGA
jgi:hypothetical protein